MRYSIALVVGCTLCWLLGLPFAGAHSAFARTSQGNTNTCDAAAHHAATARGVPVELLMAMGRVESGRSVGGVFSPWPWTVNQAGDGAFFDTASDAVDHVSKAMAAGKTNIDIGCFQINLRWHGDAFSSVQDMFDPTQNALYAADFLSRLYAEFGTWDGAVGAYHSRQSAAATAYLTKVSELIGASPAPLAEQPSEQFVARDNRYPLLQPGTSAGYGSLVATTFDRPVTPLFR